MSSVLDLEQRAGPSGTAPVATVAGLAAMLGPMPLWRIRTAPPPGEATEDDVTGIYARQKRLCELIDGTLVEKSVGSEESELAVWIAVLLSNYIRPKKLGTVLGADGMIRLAPGVIRIPDVCFISTDRLPGGKLPRKPILDVIPNLVVEVLSESNTAKEMKRKLREYFKTGVELVWHIDPKSRTVEVYTVPDKYVVLKGTQALTGGHVLPGFKVGLKRLFLG